MPIRSIIRAIPPLRLAAKAAFPAIQWLNHRRTVIKSVDGMTYELELNQLIDSTIYYFGAFEPATTAAIKSLVLPGQTVIDIGANIGCHTLLLSKLVGPRGRVLAFEPTRGATKKLARNLSLNPWSKNVHFEKLALGSEQGVCDLALKNSWPLFGHADPLKEKIECTTLDAYLEHQPIKELDFVKIDVDGYELRCLAGAAQTLSRFHPKLLVELCGYTLESVGDSLPALVNLILSHGYKIKLDSSREPFTTADEIIESIPQGSAINVVCY